MSARLCLFGAPTIEVGGQSYALTLERRSQLVVFLALRRSWVGRADLAAMLWPDLSNKLAFTNLRKTLFRLQALSWASEVELQGGALRFAAETDVLAFEQALREHDIATALSCRRGELLAGFDDDENEAWTNWLGFERERLRATWRGAALERLSGVIGPGEGIALSARLLDADPLDEAALQAHMSWLARDGKGARARQAYREFADRLARDSGLAPGAELKALHDALGAASPTPAGAPARAVGNDFVGRAVELRRLGELLGAGACRLLSVVGPGGVGKTRLARHAMQSLAAGFAHGAVFIGLEDVSSAPQFCDRLTHEFGLRPSGRNDPLGEVITFLREREMLLVLDNFEQLVAEATVLERLLHACARLRILVTSRVRLATGMEWLLQLDGLPCPEAEDLDHAESFDAVRLFLQAARRVEPALVLAVEASAIVDICRQVQGLPLALEMAAAWARVLSCDAIAAELRQGTQLLQAGDASRPARHTSMQVVFEQSWRLLGPSERDALARLSVFSGGFTADAARRVADASLPVLGALCDKSLLRKEGARLFMHPLVQQMAGLRLVDDPTREATERAHALHFLRLLAQLRRAVEDGDRDAMQWVDIECDNCRAALRWSITHEAADAAAKSVATLLHFCDHRDRLDEGLALLRAALDAQGSAGDPRLRALLLGASAHLEYRLDRYADAQATAVSALAALPAPHDHETQLQCFKVLGGCSLRLGHLEDAARFFRQALQQAPQSVDPHNAAAMLDNLALVEKAMGHYGDAMKLSMQSLAQHRRLGDFAGQALCLNNLGALHLDRDDHAAAGNLLREGLVICERHGLVSTRGLILANLTELAMKTHDHDVAQAHATRALEVAQAAGNRAVASWLRLQFARLAMHRGDFARARAELAAAVEIAIAIGRPSLQLGGIVCFGDLLDAQGEPQCASRILAFAAEHPSTAAAERDKIRARLAQRPTPGPCLGIELDELLHRIVVEADADHASLIRALRGTLQ
jgi:predicted ATPase/DNA-binding SARP family transcriptional activator/Tfp pilus assembly protein PilF